MFLTVCEKLRFPEPAVQALTEAFARLSPDPALAQAGQLFLTEGSAPAAALTALSEQYEIPFATVMAVALVQAVPALLEVYRAKGIDESICWDTLVDLRCKLIENHDVEGIWGTDPITWYQRIFTLKIFKLGRLEYEPMVYKWDTAYGHVVKDCPVLNIHIPSCGSLPMEEVMDSLQRAYRFFGSKDGEALPFICASWMLYPPMCEAVFPEGGNLHNFYRLFDVAEAYATPDNHHFWRIFGQHYHSETLADAPADTSLRRNLRSWMLKGNDMGIGRGIFLFDGEQPLHVLP